MLPSLHVLCLHDAPAVGAVLAEADRRRNYAGLIEAARRLTSMLSIKGVPVSVSTATFDGTAQMALFASQRIARGSVVVYYFGPFVPSARGVSKTHSKHAVDRSIPIDRHENTVIDGEILSAAFQDSIVSASNREILRPFVGSLANSSRGTDKIANIEIADDSSPDPVFVDVMGVRYAAFPFVASRDIDKDEELLWDYAFSVESREKLQFVDHTSLPKPPSAPKRRIELGPPKASREQRIAAFRSKLRLGA